MSSLPNPGTPPVEFQQQEKEKNKIILGNEYESEKESKDLEELNYYKEENEKNFHEDDLVEIALKRNKPKRKYKTAKLICSQFEYEFRVFDFCETDIALCFLLEPDDFKIKPKENEFILEYDGINYPVMYLGGVMNFSVCDLHQLIFMKNLDHYDKESSS